MTSEETSSISKQLMNLMDNEMYEEAQQLIKTGLQSDPTNPFFNLVEGMIYRKAGNFHKAKDVFLQKLHKQPEDPIFLSELGIVYSKLGEFENCIETINKIERLEKPIITPEAMDARTWALFHTEQYEETLYFLKGNINEDDSYGFWMASVCLWKTGHVMQAIKGFHHCSELNPNMVEPVISLVQMVLELKNEGIMRDVKNSFSKITSIFPPNTSPWNARMPYVILLLYKLDEAFNVEASLELIRKSWPPDRDIHPLTFISFVLNRDGFTSEAIELLDYGLKIKIDPYLLKTKYRLLSDNGEFHSAVEVIDVLLDQFGDRLQSYQNIDLNEIRIAKSQLMIDLNDPQGALEIIDQVHNDLQNLDDESSFQAKSCKAEVFHLLFRWEEAREIFNQLATLRPDYQFPRRVELLLDMGNYEEARLLLKEHPLTLEEQDRYRFMARFLVETEEYDAAYDMLNKMNELIPEHPYILTHLAILLSKDTKYQDFNLAMEYIREAYKLNPTNKILLEQARIHQRAGDRKTEMELLKQILVKDQYNIGALMDLAFLHMSYNDHALAEQLFSRVTLLSNSLDTAWYGLCQAQFFQQLTEDHVLDNIDHALKIEENEMNRALLYVMRANVYFNLEQFDKAIEAADIAIEAGSHDDLLYFIKSTIHTRRGDHNLAYEAMQTIFSKLSDEEFVKSRYLFPYASSLYFYGSYSRANEIMDIIPEKEQDSHFYKLKEQIEEAIEENSELS